MNENIIKVLLKSICPHCQGVILIEVESPTPEIKGILTENDITSAKEYVKKNLTENKAIIGPALEQALIWLNDETTVFGPKDADDVIKNIINEK